MTITRIAQFSAENRHLLDLISYGDGISGDISSVQAKTGTYSYRINTLDSPLGVVIPATTQIRAGYWLRPGGFGMNINSLRSISVFRALHGTEYIGARIANDTSKFVELYVDSVLQDTFPTSASPLHKKTWFHVGVTIKVGVAGFVTLYINGEQFLHWEGACGAEGIEEFYTVGRLGNRGIWFADSFMDDFYIDDAVGEVDSAPPPLRFLNSTPNGAGANAAFTPLGAAANYQAVDDAPADEETTIVQAESTALQDTHNTADITVPSGYSIQAVIPWALAKGPVGSAIKVHSYDGSLYTHSASKALRMTYTGISDYQPLTPAGGVWSQANFNSMQFGYESVL